MANLFNYDGKLMRALQKIAESLLLSLLWLLFSIPVFTIGAASAALYYTTKKSLINNQGYGRHLSRTLSRQRRYGCCFWLIMYFRE